ncbi:hypothetical protein V6N11_001866 [Hibiscus sabdariffa]|uniref:Uncharacterized protein n=1 Tax=Hibiscus sabdariffa TaxID=183260 RepID=A0ABR2QTQ1_9ROSI
MSQNLKGIQTKQEACSTDKNPSYREIVKRNLEEYGSEASSSHIADTAEPSNRAQKSSSDKVYKRFIGGLGKSPASKGTNLCSNEDEEAEEWHNGNFVNNGEMERGCIDGRSLGEEELAGFAQQAFMSDQNGGQNGIYNAENNGSVQVSKKDGAVEDTISEDLQELQGENNRSS